MTFFKERRGVGVALFVIFNIGCSDVGPSNSAQDQGVPFAADAKMDPFKARDAGTGTIDMGSAPVSNGSDRVPVLFSFHMEAKTARQCTEGISTKDCTSDEAWTNSMAVLDTLVDALDANGLKGTFQHQIQWLQRLELSEMGRSITKKMIDNGHEIALHHHGWGHGDPDGYTDDATASGDKLLGTMDDYLDWLHGWEERWSYQLVTIEGTDLNFGDNRAEWIYRTGDDQNNAEIVDLSDPTDACGYSNGKGKPAWKSLALPSLPKEAKGYSTLGHTYFGKGQLGLADCQQVYSDNIVSRTKEIIARGPKTTEAVNMVLHPILDYAHPTLTGVYDQFFKDIVATNGVVGMTVRDYMCQRASLCE